MLFREYETIYIMRPDLAEEEEAAVAERMSGILDKTQARLLKQAVWGKRKLAPAISPGKTWEGVYGGLLASLLFAAIAGGLFSHSLRWTLAFMLISLIAAMFSVAGDLLESLMKRQSGIKDSGNIIPGHGGIFDRIDSLVAAAPMFLIGYLWLAL